MTPFKYLALIGMICLGFSTTITAQSFSTADQYIEEAIKAGKNNDFEMALYNLNKAIQIDPNSSRAYDYRGAALMGKNDYLGALESFAKAISLDPRNIDSYFHRGLVYINTKQFDQAIKDFNLMLRISPDPRAYYGLGTTYHRQNALDKAVKACSDGISIALSMTLAGKDYELLRQLYVLRAIVYYDLKEYDKSRADVQALERIKGVAPAALLEGLQKVQI